MKSMIALSSVLVLFALSSTSMASKPVDLFYDCGRSFGMEVSLRIQSTKEGSEFPYKATFKGPRADATTGMISFQKIQLFGDTELTEGEEGHEVPFFFLLEVENELNHLILEKIVGKGETVEVKQILGVNPFKPEGADSIQSYQCKVTRGL
jgi:hypothetical protein